MKNSIKADIKTWVYSGRVILLTVSLIITFSISIYTSYKTFSVTNGFLVNAEKEAISIDRHDEFLLAIADPQAKTSFNGEYLVASVETAESNLHALSPEHALSYCMEMGYYVFPLLLTIFGALTIKADMSSNLMRWRITREGRWNYYFSKQIVLFMITIACTVAAMIIDLIMSAVTFSLLKKKEIFSLIDVTGSRYDNLGNRLPQILFFAFFILLFLELGFCLMVITKTFLIPPMLVLLFSYILPRYKYTPQTALDSVICSLCDFQGSVSFVSQELSPSLTVLMILLLLLVPVALATVIHKYRSAYK